MKKNYLEHEITVKFTENYLNRETDWQWFINCIDDTFEINEIYSWDEYLENRGHILSVKKYLFNICDLTKDLIFSNNLNKELFYIMQMIKGILSLNEAKQHISSQLGKLELLISYLTLLINEGNQTQYISDISILSLTNMFKKYNTDNFALYYDNIYSLIEDIKIENFTKNKQILLDNIEGVSHPFDKDYLTSLEKELINVNAFHFKTKKKDGITWEESVLYEMTNLSFDGSEIIPAWKKGDTFYPDYREWNQTIINDLIGFFKHPVADFILQTINYFVNKVEPDERIQKIHTDLLLEQIDREETLVSKYHNSSFALISQLWKDKKFKCKSIFFDKIHRIEEISELNFLYEKKFPLSNSQNVKLKDYYSTQYKSIDEVNNIYRLNDYLKKTNYAKFISKEYLKKVTESFNKYISRNDILSATTFNNYMVFLIRVHKTNTNVNKYEVQHEMIRIHELWKNEFYFYANERLTEHTSSTTIPQDRIDQLNSEILVNPFQLANRSVVTKKKDYLEIMETVSEHAIKHFVSQITLDKNFPITVEQSFKFTDRNIDEIILNIIDNLKNQYGYRLLNVLESEIYLRELYDRFGFSILFSISMFSNEDKIYEILSNKFNEYDLIEFKGTVTLAHLTQLFPILENKIKELGTHLNIFPYYISEKDFMKSKDPSSILIEIAEVVFDLTKGFENIPDILFVYNCMYNGNSLNVRNETIHGRAYQNGDKLIFAFKLTLCCLYMIIYRIDMINKIEKIMN